MSKTSLDSLFSLKGRVAAITGGGGILCSTMGKALADLGVKVALMDIRKEAAQAAVDEITKAGGTAIAVQCDVLNRDSVKAAHDEIVKAFG